MREVVAAISAVAGVDGTAPAAMSGSLAASAQQPLAPDVAEFRSMVEAGSSASSAPVGGQIFDAGVSLSGRYQERVGAARELASWSPEELGVEDRDYLRATLSVQISLNEVAVELQSTAQIANSVKDSFNALYRLQG